MKKTFIYFIAGCFALCSCNKNPLDITPDGRITFDDVFKNEIQTESFVNTIYAKTVSYTHLTLPTICSV